MKSTKLQEIVDVAKKGYISDQKEVEKIVNQFIDLTLDEIDNNSTKDYKACFGALPLSVGLSSEHLGKLKYIDLINLIDNIPHSEFFRIDSDDDIFTFQLFQIDILRKFLMATKGSLETDAFLSLNVKSFYDYLESRHHNKHTAEAYSNLAYQVKSYLQEEFSEAATISELIQKVSTSKDACWKPWIKKIQQHQKHTLDGFNILKLLLIRSIQIGFKERSNLDDIIDKYSKEENAFEAHTQKYNKESIDSTIKTP